MTSRTVTLTPSIDRIKKWIEEVTNDPKARRRALTLGTLELADRARVYPPEGLYNHEPGAQGNGVWYQRQFGARRRRKDGTLWTSRRKSEKLQKNWKAEIHPGDYSAEVFTRVSYAPYLYDPVRRVSWAASHGWQTIDEIADGYSERFKELILEIIDDQIDRKL